MSKGAPDAALWASLPCPALVIGADGRIARANTAAEAFLNASEKSLRKKTLPQALESATDLVPALDRVRESGAEFAVWDLEAGPPGAPPLMCNLRLGPMQEAPDNVLLLIDPRQIGGRMARGRLMASVRSATGMSQMLAHEIKNPLAGITGAAQLLQMALPDDSSDRELTELIVAETRRVTALLTQVEQFGNMQPPRVKPVNLHDLIERARRSSALGVARDMRFEENFDPSLPLAHADPDQIIQVLTNLMRNAAQAAGPSGGTLRLRTYYDGTLRMRDTEGHPRPLPLQIEITDDGPGIPAELREQIFDPFVSGRENGTGLGLALVSKIMSDHGGWVAVQSRPGKTTFRLSLPLAPDQRPAKE